MQRGGTVYIMTNALHSVLYTGVTGDLLGRVQQHKNKVFSQSFTAKYNVNILVFYQSFPTIEEAILEEKRIKAGNRKQKLLLIDSLNPQWNDLYKVVCTW